MLDSLSLGTVSESLYGFGGVNYSDPRDSRYFQGFADFLADVGLPLFLPLGGLSEVNSMRISLSNPAVTAWSCIRGENGMPCMNCYKCFRKESLKADLLSKSWSSDQVNTILSTPEVSRKISGGHIHHGNVLAWQVQNFPKAAYWKLTDSIRPYQAQLTFIEKWFAKSIEYVPEKYRHGFKQSLKKFTILTMTNEESKEAMNWKGK